MLADAALRAARVVVDIGLHLLDLPLPDGSRWTFAAAREFLGERPRRTASGSPRSGALRGCC